MAAPRRNQRQPHARLPEVHTLTVARPTRRCSRLPTPVAKQMTRPHIIALIAATLLGIGSSVHAQFSRNESLWHQLCAAELVVVATPIAWRFDPNSNSSLGQVAIDHILKGSESRPVVTVAGVKWKSEGATRIRGRGHSPLLTEGTSHLLFLRTHSHCDEYILAHAQGSARAYDADVMQSAIGFCKTLLDAIASSPKANIGQEIADILVSMAQHPDFSLDAISALAGDSPECPELSQCALRDALTHDHHRRLTDVLLEQGDNEFFASRFFPLLTKAQDPRINLFLIAQLRRDPEIDVLVVGDCAVFLADRLDDQALSAVARDLLWAISVPPPGAVTNAKGQAARTEAIVRLRADVLARLDEMGL